MANKKLRQQAKDASTNTTNTTNNNNNNNHTNTNTNTNNKNKNKKNTNTNSTSSNKNNKPNKKARKLPVTLLSGFLGAGKTTLLKHILESSEHGLRIAVIVNDMAALNIDAALIEQQRVVQTKAELVAMQNGCICCTLRTDLIREIARIQAMDAFDYLVIESTGLAEPMQVAEAFCTDPETGALPVERDAESESESEEEQDKKKKVKRKTHTHTHADKAAKKEKKSKPQMLHDLARLDTCVTVVDAHDFPIHAQSLQTFKERFPSEMDNTQKQSEALGESNTDGEGEKNIGQLLIEQVEFANVLIVNKTDLVSEEALKDLITLLRTLNPQAHILPSTFSRVDLKEILDTKRFDLDAASNAAGWLQSLRADTDTPAHSEKDEYGVSSFVYRARRPFHPYRLQRFAESVFAFSDEWEESKGKRKNTLLTKQAEQRRQHMLSRYGGILRSKGFCWVAGRDGLMVQWSQQGRLLSLAPLQQWYVDLLAEQDKEKEHYHSHEHDHDHGEDEHDHNHDHGHSHSFSTEERALIERDFVAPFGDRRQEIVFIGTRLQEEAITTTLNACLLTEEELDVHEIVHATSASEYLDTLPPWAMNVEEEGVFSAIVRDGQTFVFSVAEGASLSLTNAALNVRMPEGAENESEIVCDEYTVKLWLDRSSAYPLLLCTLRTRVCEQYALSNVRVPACEDEESSYTLRAEVVPAQRKKRKSLAVPQEGESERDRLAEPLVEVFVVGHVTVEPRKEEEDEEEGEDENEDVEVDDE